MKERTFKRLVFAAIVLLGTVLFTTARGQCDYNPSSQLSFYFVAGVEGMEITDDCWIEAYCGDVCVGSKQWFPYVDVPVYGYDGTTQTTGYCTHGEVPQFFIIPPVGEAVPVIEIQPEVNSQGQLSQITWEQLNMPIVTLIVEGETEPPSNSLLYFQLVIDGQTKTFSVPADLVSPVD